MLLLNILRPLVESKAWDYCIVWKLRDDPSRCIEWIGCCCSGSQGVCENVKEENDEIELRVRYVCRDGYVKHSIRTRACEKLAMIPSTLSSFCGIHGKVAVTKQPLWLSNESIGTQIVVPVEGGLIELFRSKHVPEDQRMIEALISHLGVIMDHVLHTDDSKNCLNSYLYNHIGPKLELGFRVPQPITHSNTHGFSSGNGKEDLTTKQKKKKESKYQSKNLITERNRRKRIKDGLYTLRALVPRISKMDKASILGDAIEYIIDLQKNVKELQDELNDLEEQDWKVTDDEVEVEVDLHEIGDGEFLLKLICSHKPDGFIRLMEALDSQGLEVIGINVTTCKTRVLNILNLKAKEKEVVAKSLRDFLLTVCTMKTVSKTRPDCSILK